MFLIRQLRNRNGFRFVSRQWFLLRLKINSIYNGYVELFKFQSIFVHSVFCDRNLQNRRRRKSFNKHVIFLSQNLQTDWKKQNMNFWCEKKKKKRTESISTPGRTIDHLCSELFHLQSAISRNLCYSPQHVHKLFLKHCPRSCSSTSSKLKIFFHHLKDLSSRLNCIWES